MIEEIRIENLGVINAAQVPLHPRLTVITGETGAGKTMVLTGLSLLMGGRADAATVRSGSATAAVEGLFIVTPGSPALERAREAGAGVDDDGALLAVRTVAAAGRSRAHLGGRSVPQSVLVEVTSDLVTVHGQSDQARLRSARHQRQALDEAAGQEHAESLDEYRRLWQESVELAVELGDLVLHGQEREREAQLLRLGLAEIERVDPQPGEDLELAREAERLGHGEELRAAAAHAHAALAEDEQGQVSALLAVDTARRALEGVAEHDAELAGLATRVAEIAYLVADVATEVSAYADGLQSDPARLEAVQQRRAELTSLARAYGGSVDGALAWASSAGLRLLELDGSQDRVSEVEGRLADIRTALTATASRVSAGREHAAGLLGSAVTQELRGLAMADARLDVVLTPTPELGPWGAEDVEMLLVPHAGAPARPLGAGASGGELSRIMLALEVALATLSTRHGELPTFVFDEVDAGVGGRAAVEVGRRLAHLANDAQVIVVTHLAQVAAFADRHLVVTKSRSGDQEVVTASDVRVVEGEERVAELARMLSGHDDSQTAVEHAAELLRLSTVGR